MSRAEYAATLKSLMPPPDTRERMQFLQAAMDVLVDAIIEHSEGDLDEASIGFRVIVLDGLKRLAMARK